LLRKTDKPSVCYYGKPLKQSVATASGPSHFFFMIISHKGDTCFKSASARGSTTTYMIPRFLLFVK
jgi:hypothetical protein